MSAAQHDPRAILTDIARRAMLDYGLLPDFSPEARAQVQAIARPAVQAGIRDLRGAEWVSIDNDDSRDLDQLSVAQPLDGTSTRLLVAIADVDASVPRGSPIDDHARHNTTSVYTAGHIFPMLPEQLSTDLTSLVQGAERLAVIMELDVTAAGDITASDIYRATVVNKAKLAYDSVAAWLEGSGPVPAALAAAGLQDQVRLQDRVAQSLGRVRHAQGALTLETIQTSAVFEGALLRDLVPERTNRAHELIENIMVAANGVAARWLQNKGQPALRRVLRTPEHWDRIVAVAAEHHAQLPSTPDPVALNAFLAQCRRQRPEQFPDLSLAIIKLLGRGEYALELPGAPVAGHFGLAVTDYMHSTAPNRRFPDVIVQRLIKSVLDATPAPYTQDELADLAGHCTVQEDNAAKVERLVGKSAAALLLRTRIGQSFDAIVTGAADKGTWARTLAPPVEGRIVRGFQGLKVGQQVRVRLLSTDVSRGFIDFAREG
ncbi:MAG TPA: RNB domain-containing ribonuclease [Steroidobacteraceae bacterium]|nr:RNB domain-containing ribonuclease [Steroidobacteraceae bacterium]